jgi:putative membrane protein
MTQRTVKVIILLALGVFLYTRVTSGVILYYINERFVTLTLLAAVGLILVGASFFRQSDHHHDHHEHGDLSWLGLLIVALPVVLGLLTPPRPLGANALGNREVTIGRLTSAAAPGGSGAPRGLVAGEKNILDWLADFQHTPDPAAFAGQEARIIGFVYRDERFDADTFMVGRFIVSCCVADASPVGLIVQWPASAELPTDQWVEVTGHFQAGRFAGGPMPILVAEQVSKTESPAQPYLYR